MPLPVNALSTGSVLIAGQPVEFRAVSRDTALRLAGLPVKDAEILLLTAATGCSVDEAQAFREGNSVADAGLLIDAILDLSGLTEDESPDPKAPGTGTNELSPPES